MQTTIAALVITSSCLMVTAPRGLAESSTLPADVSQSGAVGQAKGKPSSATAWARHQANGVDALQQRRYVDAERSFLLGLREAKAGGAPGTTVAAIENSLGLTYRAMKRFSESEQMYRKALVSMEQAKGATFQDVSAILANLAALMIGQQRYQDAEPHLRRALSSAGLGRAATDYKLALTLYELGDVCLRLRKYDDADRFLSRALKIREQHRGARHVEVGLTEWRLAALRVEQKRPVEAVPLFEKALATIEAVRGRGAADALGILRDYAAALRQSGRSADADRMVADLKSRTAG